MVSPFYVVIMVPMMFLSAPGMDFTMKLALIPGDDVTMMFREAIQASTTATDRNYCRCGTVLYRRGNAYRNNSCKVRRSGDRHVLRQLLSFALVRSNQRTLTQMTDPFPFANYAKPSRRRTWRNTRREFHQLWNVTR